MGNGGKWGLGRHLRGGFEEGKRRLEKFLEFGESTELKDEENFSNGEAMVEGIPFLGKGNSEKICTYEIE